MDVNGLPQVCKKACGSTDLPERGGRKLWPAKIPPYLLNPFRSIHARSGWSQSSANTVSKLSSRPNAKTTCSVGWQSFIYHTFSSNIIVNTGNTKKTLLEADYIPAEKIWVIYNGLDTAEIDQERSERALAEPISITVSGRERQEQGVQLSHLQLHSLRRKEQQPLRRTDHHRQGSAEGGVRENGGRTWTPGTCAFSRLPGHPLPVTHRLAYAFRVAGNLGNFSAENKRTNHRAVFDEDNDIKRNRRVLPKSGG